MFNIDVHESKLSHFCNHFGICLFLRQAKIRRFSAVAFVSKCPLLHMGIPYLTKKDIWQLWHNFQ